MKNYKTRFLRMKKLHLELAINSLSFGNVSFNFLKEINERGIQYAFFPIGGNIDISAFDIPAPFSGQKNHILENLKLAMHERLLRLDRDAPTFKMWHINGSENRIARNQYLYTFYECNEPTPFEVSIVNSQEHVFFSSQHAVDAFKNRGCERVSYVPIGFDKTFTRGKELARTHKYHFGLIGKWEKRKNTELIIKTWLKKFGNNPDFLLSCLVDNPFFQPEQMNTLKQSVTEGQNYNNLNFIHRLSHNLEVATLQKNIDFDLSGLSNAEGWNLPAFNATALGKWSAVTNITGHKGWATNDNCVLVEPDGEQECYDGMFFQNGAPFNQGTYAYLSESTIEKAMDQLIEKSEVNQAGLELQNMTYTKSMDQILAQIES